MKTCSRCKETKELDKFNKNKSKKDGYQYYCKECQKAGTKRHYENNKQRYKDNAKKHKLLLIEWYNEYKKNLKCSKCPESRHYCLDFHHVNPDEKEHEVSQMIRYCGSKRKMLEEIEKCIVVCKNCHAEIHFLERYTP